MAPFHRRSSTIQARTSLLIRYFSAWEDLASRRMKQSAILSIITASTTSVTYPQPSMGFPTDLCIFQGWRMLPLCIHLTVTTPSIIKTVLLPRLVIKKWMSCLTKPHLFATHTQPTAREMGKMTGFQVTSALTKRIRTIVSVSQFTPMC